MAIVDVKPMYRPVAPAQDWRTVPRKIGYVCWIFAGFLGVMAAITAYSQYQRMSSWTPVEATVTSREVYWDYSRSSKGGTSVVYGARFTFTYAADGRRQTGVADLGYRSSFRSWIERQADALPVGAQRQVRVNPVNPAEISLASDFGELSFASAYFLFSLCLIMLAIGLALWWWSLQLVHSYRNQEVLVGTH